MIGRILREAQRQQELHAEAEALSRAQYEHYRANLEADLGRSDIRREAEQGVVLDGVVVRKPQPRLT